MRFFPSSYRDLPRFMLRRIEEMAGHVNGFLAVIAIGLVGLYLLVFLQKFAGSAPLPIIHLPPPTP